MKQTVKCSLMLIKTFIIKSGLPEYCQQARQGTFTGQQEAGATYRNLPHAGEWLWRGTWASSSDGLTKNTVSRKSDSKCK
jgi:hypothetical protein